MAEPVSAQDRLDKIVVMIAANMVAEVCSVYVLRVDQTLELYATEGLNRDAVHQTVMPVSEGLVGHVAREAESVAISDAQNHPEFSYRPETGERGLQLLPWRADPAGRQHAGRSGGAEPRPPHLCGRGDRGAPDHRHGAGGDDRLR